MTTGIEWTDETWNFLRGCSRKSRGCQHCYAEQAAARVNRQFAALGRPQPYGGLIKLVARKSGDQTIQEPRWTGEVRFIPERLAAPLGWRKPRDIFVNSMSDLFHEDVPNEVIAAAYGVMAACRQHTFQILTKRLDRARRWFQWARTHGDGQDRLRFGPSALLTCAWEACAGEIWGEVDDPFDGEIPSAERFGTTWPLPNVCLGASVEDQPTADERVPDLLACDAALYFLSCEPLLDRVDLVRPRQNWLSASMRPDHPASHDTRRVGWVIAGCESGPGARPAEPSWYRLLRDQCAAAGVPFFLKQARCAQEDIHHGSMVSGSRFVINGGPGAKRKPGGVIALPYLNGVQHKSKPEMSR